MPALVRARRVAWLVEMGKVRHVLLFVLSAGLAAAGAVALLTSDRTIPRSSSRSRDAWTDSPGEAAPPRSIPAQQLPGTLPDAASAQSALPDVYLGPVTVSGYVRLADGAAVPGQSVLCLPDGFEAVTASERAHCSALSTPDGRFVIGQLPLARVYSLSLVGSRYFGRTSARRTGDEESVECDLVVSGVDASRLRCVDEATREPVDVSLVTIRKLAGATVLGDSAGRLGESDFYQAVPRDLWQARKDRGEILLYWSGAMPHARAPILEIDVPGYRKREVALREDGEGPPADQTVELVREPLPTGSVVWRFSIPQPRLPPGWGGYGTGGRVVLLAKNVRTGVTRSVYDNAPGFVAESDARFELRFVETWLSRESLSYHVERSGSCNLVAPELPDFAYAEIHYDPKPRMRDADTVVIAPPPGSLLWPRRVYPGCARYGPVPVGEYRLARREVRIEGTREHVVHEDARNVTLAPGLNDLGVEGW